MDTDPYAGLTMPTPPKGYRLARWGETYNGECFWWGYNSHCWHTWARLTGSSNDYQSKAEPERSIFAIPKPRVRIPLEVM